MNMKSMRPIAAVRAIRELFANPDETRYVFEIIEALQGPSLVRLRDRLRNTEQGCLHSSGLAQHRDQEAAEVSKRSAARDELGTAEAARYPRDPVDRRERRQHANAVVVDQL